MSAAMPKVSFSVHHPEDEQRMYRGCTERCKTPEGLQKGRGDTETRQKQRVRCFFGEGVASCELRERSGGAMEGEEQLQQPPVATPHLLYSYDWQTLKQDEVKLVVTALALFLTLVTLFFAAGVAFRRKKPKSVLLVGLNGAGKTALFFQLKDGTTHQGAVTSMEPNDETFVLHSEATKKGKIKPVHIVDVPGHPKLRPHLEELLPKSCCLVFVVDAHGFMPYVRAAAEYLYDILTNKEVVKRKIPLLLTCNKMDKVTAHSSNFIKGQLEKELNKLRKSRSAISSADVSSEIHLGVEGEDGFNFTQCSNKITIAEISALTGNVEQVEKFIREHVK